MIGEREIKKICQDVLQRCKDGQAEVMLTVNDSSLTRFANNTIHQNVAERDTELMVRFFIGKQSGSATSNRLDERGLDELVEQARLNAKASPEDPAYPGLPEPAAYQQVNSYDPDTASFSPEGRAQLIAPVCRLACQESLNAFGAFSTGEIELAIANTLGVFAYHAASSANFQTVIMGEDSSGWAQGSGWKVSEFDPESLGREAIHKTLRGRHPQKIEPGEYIVVLDHYVTEDILSMLNFSGMGAQAVLEGRSWMNDRIGQQVMHPSVSIWDDGLDPNGTPMPFDFEGVPKQRVELVRQGVVLGPVYDSYVGAKMSKPSTGHAIPTTMRGFGPIAMNLFMGGGSSSVDEMIHSTQHGLYITRFWYTRPVHPRDAVITGMTRDGVFMIVDGELAFPVKNLRFTQSYVEALANVEAVGRETHLLGTEFGGFSMRVPALKISKFNFTGVTG
jgi:predicted Zn-dependent protease